jgi:hypothetical protein
MSVPYQDLGEVIEDQNPYGDGALPAGLAAKVTAAVAAAVAAAAAAAAGNPAPVSATAEVAVDGVPDAINKSKVTGNLLNLEFLSPAQELDALFWEFNDEHPFKHGYGYRITKAIKIKYTWVLGHAHLSAADQANPAFAGGKTITSHLLIGYSGPNGD